MKTNRSRMMVRCLVFASLAVCFSAAMLSAEEWSGTFSLPFEARWDRVVLPPGDYSVYFNTAGNGQMVLRQGTRRIGLVWVSAEETPATSAKSQLLIVREGGTANVHILYVAELGLGTEFHFKVPERYEVYTRLIARADEPAAIQRIPVRASGK